ncbi:MAG TPA: GNAT family N-acetyltransferase [Bryobacteraceae bacterium]
MTDVHIREASEDDLPAILRAYSESGIGGGQSFTPEEAREQFARFRQYPSYRVFVAVVDGNVGGTYALIILDNLAKRGARAGVVEDVAVLPEHQRQGIGQAMMAHAREECRLAGCYKLTLSSGLPRESAHRFYESLGFERHGYSFLIRP